MKDLIEKLDTLGYVPIIKDVFPDALIAFSPSVNEGWEFLIEIVPKPTQYIRVEVEKKNPEYVRITRDERMHVPGRRFMKWMYIHVFRGVINKDAFKTILLEIEKIGW